MTNKTVKRKGVVHITQDGKIAFIKIGVASDLHFDFPRGVFGGHVDNEPFVVPAQRELKEG
jgi:hypothetical protein